MNLTTYGLGAQKLNVLQQPTMPKKLCYLISEYYSGILLALQEAMNTHVKDPFHKMAASIQINMMNLDEEAPESEIGILVDNYGTTKCFVGPFNARDTGI